MSLFLNAALVAVLLVVLAVALLVGGRTLLAALDSSQVQEMLVRPGGPGGRYVALLVTGTHSQAVIAVFNNHVLYLSALG